MYEEESKNKDLFEKKIEIDEWRRTMRQKT